MVELIWVVAAHLSIEQHTDVLNVFKVIVKATVQRFLRPRWYFYWLIPTCLSRGFGLVSLYEESLGRLISRRS